MRAVVQRVSAGRVFVGDKVVGECGTGFVVLVAAGKDDSETNAQKLADRVYGMRVFPDDAGRMNLNLQDFEKRPGHGASKPNVLAVSNFTVYGDATQRRPSFGGAAAYGPAETLFDVFVAALRKLDARVATGVFGADMTVEIVNDGPVTLVVEA